MSFLLSVALPCLKEHTSLAKTRDIMQQFFNLKKILLGYNFFLFPEIMFNVKISFKFV
jgi:hypothetical protein